MELNVPAIGILRGIEKDFFAKVMQTSFSSGLEAIEVTMNTKDADKIVSSCRKEVPKGKMLGMGTIRNVAEAKIAVESGAMFLVTPNYDPHVIEYAELQNIPIIAGAFTPTEVYNAWAGGADMVKVFPCQPVGPLYIKELLGPFDQIPLVAVGGITLDNLSDYFNAGAKAVGVSSSLFGKQALKDKDIDLIGKNVLKFCELLPRNK